MTTKNQRIVVLIEKLANKFGAPENWRDLKKYTKVETKDGVIEVGKMRTQPHYSDMRWPQSDWKSKEKHLSFEPGIRLYKDDQGYQLSSHIIESLEDGTFIEAFDFMADVSIDGGTLTGVLNFYPCEVRKFLLRGHIEARLKVLLKSKSVWNESK